MAGRSCLALLLLVALFLPVPAAGGNQARFLDGAGNVRAGPGTTQAIIRVPAQGTVVKVLHRKGPWWHIRFADGVEGRCHQTNLEAVAPTSAGGELLAFKDGEGNVRRGPGTTHPVVLVPPRGTTVEVIGHRDQWRNIRFPDGFEGWCHASNLEAVPTGPAGKAAPEDGRPAGSFLEADLTGDGRRERILLERYQTRNGDPADADYFLRVRAPGTHGKILWEDATHQQSFYIGHAGVEGLQVAGDIDGDGIVELVSPRTQSDVRPPHFRVLEWREGSFQIADGGFLYAPADNPREFLWSQAELPGFDGISWISEFLTCETPGHVRATVISQTTSETLFGEGVFRGSPEGFVLERWTKALIPME